MNETLLKQLELKSDLIRTLVALSLTMPLPKKREIMSQVQALVFSRP